MKDKIDEIRKELEKQMTPERYQHTIGVMYTGAALAMRYDADIKKTMLAGLLHDCAKTVNYPREKLLILCREQNIPISESESVKPELLHAKAGAYLANQRYGISDPEILNAIIAHTTGRPEMTLLDKIIYIADFIEPGRDEASNLPIVRNMAFVDLDACLLRILEDTLSYLKEKKDIIDPMTVKTYNYYKKLLNK